MDDGLLYLFERCKSYKDRKISINDFTGVVRVLRLPEQVMERVSADSQGRVLYDDFVAVYNIYFDDNETYRPGIRTSRYHYSKQTQQVPLRESTDNTGKKERKEADLHGRTHRGEDRVKKSSNRGYHEDQYSSVRLPSKTKKSHPRSVIESHKSEGSDCSDDEPIPYNSTSPMTSLQRSSHCKHCVVQDRRVEELEEDLQAVRKERKRLENSMHSIRNDFQSYYKKASELQAENDRLRSRLTNKYVDSEYVGDSGVSDLQHEKARRHLEDKLSYSEGMIMSLQKENHKFQEDIARLKNDRNRLHNKNRDIEKELWRVQNEVQDLSIQLLQEQKSRSAAPGSSEKPSKESLCFNGIGTLRNTFHGKSRYDDEVDVRQRKGLPIQRISSAGAELSGADNSQLEQHPVRDETGRHSGRRARSHKSVKSEDSDGLALHFTNMEFPDDNLTVFKVLGHEVSKGALPDTISEEVRNAMVKSLENCHSVQEVIRLMVSYGCSPMSEKLQGIQVENERLQKKLDRIKSEHRTLQLSFQEAKEMEEMWYGRCQQLECNEGYLQRSLYYCQHALEANELLVEVKSLPSEHGRNGYPSHFSTYDTGSISEASSRSPDHSSRRHSLIMKAKTLLQALDTDQCLQELYQCHSQEPASSSLSTTWQPELSQNTTSGVSGISSLSSIDGDLNNEEVERLKTYSRIMKSYSNKMDNVVALEAIAARPKSHVAPDTYRCESSSPIVELEKATHAEELATIREEKAELRSRIYMMEQNQRRLELELSQKDIQNKALNKAITHLQYQVQEEKRRRKREKSRVKKDGNSGMVSYEGHVTDLTCELQEHMEREKELVKQYEELYCFLSEHVAKAKDNHDQLLEFIQDLKRANNALVEAYEKSKLKQKMERRHMQQEYNRALVLGHHGDQPPDGALRQNQARL